jgi:hypothetical protein
MLSGAAIAGLDNPADFQTVKKHRVLPEGRVRSVMTFINEIRRFPADKPQTLPKWIYRCHCPQPGRYSRAKDRSMDRAQNIAVFVMMANEDAAEAKALPKCFLLREGGESGRRGRA